MLNIHTDLTMEGIEIYTVSGQLIHAENSNGNDHSVNMANLSSGLYLIKVQTSVGVITKRFAK